MDIYEDEHNITLKLEVPGIDEKDMNVHYENTTLTVHGERKMRRKRKRRTTESRRAAVRRVHPVS